MSLSLFGAFEAYSWAPGMHYNDAEQSPTFPKSGIDSGTRIGDGKAYSIAGGARIMIVW